MKVVSILIGATIGEILVAGIGFATDAIMAGTRGWLTPLVHVVVENRSGQDVADVVLTHLDPKRCHGFNDKLLPAEFKRRYFERLAGV